ncbi:MAG: HDOD domain-containing protein [Planctomycetota bacterium]
MSAPATSTSSGVPEVVSSAIQEISHIATLPEVTIKIIKLVEDPDSTAQDLNKVISNDPALGARILKVVNSAFYGLPGQIGSINRAIVLLGLNAVKNIAIAASLAKLFRGGKICPHFDARDLWNQSVACAAGTRLLADRIDLGLPDEAFLAGLIHDLGIMVEVQARRGKFVDAVELCINNPGLSLREAERKTIGADHEQFGAELCRTWKFPASFTHVTGFHHRPMELAAEHRTLTGLVYVADHITHKLELGFQHGAECQELPEDLLKALNLSATAVEEVAAQVPAAMDEARAIFAQAA